MVTEAPVEATEAPEEPFTPAEGAPFQCSAPGVVASSEDCRKFWLCKEQEEGSRVLEVGHPDPLHPHPSPVPAVQVPRRLPLQHGGGEVPQAGGGLLPPHSPAGGRFQVGPNTQFLISPSPSVSS